ncbi:ABC transporter permease [Nocardioides sp. AX2bis]|uniref:ABC transporter permease n=1 Tax=Nocardioides sp. AX2bis TaxID=2653157 RepID=UPI0012F3FFDF|nr:ABC transporter permease [Nocardioides sp. AX2bis]VXB54472.1 Dipeptide transport system permease protein DppC [Nocardioides sp. AX2bis]
MSVTLPPAAGPVGTPGGDPAGAPGLVPDQPGVGLWRGAFRRLRRNPTAIAGAVIILLFVLVAVFAPLLTSYQPGAAEDAGKVTPLTVPGPSEDHWLGLDRYGSDMWTQLVYGARQSLLYGVVSTAIGLTLGAGLGAIAGGFGALGGRVGGWVDNAVMRFVDIMLSVPSLLLAVSIVAVLGQNAYAVMIAIGVAQVPIFARLLRGSMLSQGKADYVLAAGALGLRKRRIVAGHMVPNAIGPTIVQATLNLATAIIEVAALSYLGLGESDPAVAEWGRMLVAAQERFDSAARLALLPGFAIAITALGFTLLGEAMREALDPRTRR